MSSLDMEDDRSRPVLADGSPEKDPVRLGIARLRARWWQVNLLRVATQSAFYATIAGTLVVLAFPALAAVTVAWAIVAAAVTAALVASAVRAPDALAHAKAHDDAAGLADRLSSSLELAREPGPMVAALREEAARVALATSVTATYPLRLPREGRWLPLPLLTLVLALALPSLLAPRAHADEAFVSSLEERVAALEELISNERERPATQRKKELLDELERLRAELDQPDVDKRDTQAEVARLLERLRDEARDKERREEELRELLKSLQEDTQKHELDPNLQHGDYQQAMNRLEQELEELRKELERKRREGATPEELEALEEKIDELRELQAKLYELMQLDLDLAFLGQTIDFLHAWDGELGELAEFDPAAIEPGEPCPDCLNGEP